MSDLPSFDGRQILVAGLGVTGNAVCEALRSVGRDVVTFDQHQPADFADENDIDLGQIGLVIASPGWPPHSSFLRRVAAADVPIWSEVELAWRMRVANAHTGRPAAWLALTGTNGKTTTVEMLGSILAAANLRHAVVGNVGRPLIVAAMDSTLEVLAIELSSFQLHFTESMQADAAAVLNLASDHLDWHGSMAAYGADKAKIFAGARRACVYPVGDEAVTEMVRDAEVSDGARAVGFTVGAPGPGDIGIVEGLIVDRAFHAPDDSPTRQRHAAELATIDDLGHLAPGSDTIPTHIVKNALAAAALARSIGVEPAAVAAGLRNFEPGHHRIETIAVVDEVRYVDDSKATNPHAARAALLAQPDGSVVWIAGGLPKGVSFDDLVAEVRSRLRAVVLIGTDRSGLLAALSRHAPNVPVSEVADGDTETVMPRAVNLAARAAKPGDVVLLAPACASMDQFRSYAHRGDAFAMAVGSLAGAREAG